MGESYYILLAKGTEGEVGATKYQRKGHLQNLELQRSHREEPPAWRGDPKSGESSVEIC